MQPRSCVRFIGIAFALLIALTACAPTSSTGGSPSPSGSLTPKAGGTLTVGTSQDVLTLDLPNYRSTQDLLVGGLVFDTLIGYQDGQFVPELAESWKQTDGQTYQFTLRHGVKFQDGTPMNAAAIKSYFERAKTALKAGRFYGDIDTITTNGDYDISFHLKRTFTPFLGNLAFAVGGVQSPASIQKYGQDIVHNAVGTGPFKLTSWVQGDKIILDRNPDYWGPKPLLDEIVIKYIADDSTRTASLQSGELDVIQNAAPSQASAIKSSKDLQLITGSYAQTFWLGFTATNQYLKDPRVRQAIAMTVDRTGLVNSVTEGIARIAGGFIPPELEPSTVKPITGDTTKAKQLLADAGYPNGFSIDLWTPNGTYLKDKEIAQALQQPLKAIGVTANIKVLDYAAYADGLNRHEAGLFLLGWAHTPSPDSFYRGVFYSKSTSNWSAYNNPKVDQLIDQAVGESSYEAAVKIWQQIDQMLIDDAAGAPIYWSTVIYAARKRVHGFSPTPFGQWDVSKTWVE
jgi:peptide/nickel transport system substrate-binding protein